MRVHGGKKNAMSYKIGTIKLEGGARLGISRLPGRHGNVLRDLKAIKAWAPTIVLSMTETFEMDRHKVADLGGLLSRSGIEWIHLPTKDFSVPSAPWSREWPEISRKLHSILDQQGSILAHCYGGQGRSAMILLRLMVERGEDANAALARLRAVVPRAIETAPQFEWAASGAPEDCKSRS